MDRLSLILECPVCLLVRRDTPILQCVNGHAICAPCKADTAVVACPTARCAFDSPPRRCLRTEMIIAACYLHDPDSVCGCVKVQKHDPECEGRTVPCPHAKCVEKVKAKNVVSHLRTAHKSYNLTQKEDTIELSWYVKYCRPAPAWTPSVVKFNGTHFVINFGRSDDGSSYYSWVQVVGDEDMADGLKVVIEASGHGNKFVAECKVSSIDKAGSAIMEEEGTCLRLSREMMCRCASHDVTGRWRRSGYTHVVAVRYRVMKKVA